MGSELGLKRRYIVREKGVTLVALVITIIVMLILIGATVKIVADTGLIGNTKTAAEAYKEQQAKEKLSLKLDDLKVKSVKQGINDGIERIKTLISIHGKDNVTIELENGEVKLETYEKDGKSLYPVATAYADGYIFKIDEDLNIIEVIKDTTNTNPGSNTITNNTIGNNTIEEPEVKVAKYTVEYYQENIEGTGYDIVESIDQTDTIGNTVQAEIKVYEGFTHNSNHQNSKESGKVTSDGALTLKVYYSRNNDIAYTVEYYQENLEGSGYDLVESDSTRRGRTGATANLTEADKTKYTGFAYNEERSIETGTIEANGGLVLKAYYTRRNDIAYTVEYYQENLEGSGYDLVESDSTRRGRTGATANLTEADKTKYTGFAYNEELSTETGTIEANGGLVLKAYYTRRNDIAYTVEYYQENLEGSGYDLVESDPARSGRTGATANLTEADKTKYTGFAYKEERSTETGTIEANGGLVLKAYYDREEVTYYEEHYIQKVDQTGYELKERIDKIAKFGKLVKIEAKKYEGCTPVTKEENILSDYAKEGLILKQYHDRNSYQVTVNPTPSTGGTVTGNGSNIYGNSVTITAIPNVGYDGEKPVFTSSEVTLPTPTETTVNGNKAYTLTFTMPAKAVNVGVTFVPNTYTIHYDGNGLESDISGSTLDSIHIYGVEKNLSKNGFSKQCTITYETNGGSQIANATVTSSIPQSPEYCWENETTKEKYKDEQAVENVTQKNGETITLKAQWNDKTITLPEPTRTGFNFDGWYENSDYSGKSWGAGENYTVTESKTLYASWTEKPIIQYTVYDYLENANDENYSLYQTRTLSAQQDSTVILANTKAINGDLSTSYSTYQYGTVNGVKVTETTVTEGLIINLYYDRKEFTLTLTTNNTSSITYIASTTGAGSYKWGATNIPIKATEATDTAEYDYSFENWTSSNTSVIANTNNQSTTVTMPKSSLTVRANGTRNAQVYKVSYEGVTNGGAGVEYVGQNATQESGEWYYKPNEVGIIQKDVAYHNAVDLESVVGAVGERWFDGWRFVGWNTDPNATTGLTSLSMPAKNITLYAIYKREVTVTFIDYNGTTQITRTVTGNMYNNETETSIVTPTIGTYTGWTARYWTTSTSNNVTSPTVSSGGTITGITNDTTYYARYYQSVTATFIDYNGTTKTSRKITPTRETNSYNVTNSILAIKAPTINTYTGYSKTWKARYWTTSTSANASSAISNGGTINITGNGASSYTYYARYYCTITIAFNVNGGTGSVASKTGNIEKNSYSIASSSNPSITMPTYTGTKSGYTNSKTWTTEKDGSGTAYTQGVTYSFNHNSTQNLTLYAKWDAQQIGNTLKTGDILEYPVNAGSYSFTTAGISYLQTVSLGAGTIKCAVLHNDSNGVEIVPVSNEAVVDLNRADYIYETIDEIAKLWYNPTYSDWSYGIGSAYRTNYTVEEDVEAINSFDFQLTFGTGGQYSGAPSNITTLADFNSHITDSSDDTAWVGDNIRIYYEQGYLGFTEEYRAVSIIHYGSNGLELSDCLLEMDEWENEESDTDYRWANRKGVLPVIHLKDNLVVTGGSGTDSSPYQLGVSN